MVIWYWHGLPRDELCHILDLKDGYVPNSPGETFRVLKEKEKKYLGEYPTRRLVFKAWDINKPSLPWVLLINKV